MFFNTGLHYWLKMYIYLIVFFIKFVKWKRNLNSVTDIWNTVNKLNKAFAMRAGAHRSYLQALKKTSWQLTYYIPRAWETITDCSWKEAREIHWVLSCLKATNLFYLQILLIPGDNLRGATAPRLRVHAPQVENPGVKDLLIRGP